MSKIPYYFNTPVPRYFWEIGWLNVKSDGDHFKRLFFLQWCFSRCSREEKEVFHDHKTIILQPYEFIFGRRSCSEETGLTEREIRTYIDQLFCLPKGKIIEKTTNSVTNRFTCYKWMTSHFLEFNDQPKDQPATNRRPTDDHKLEVRINKKETTSLPPKKENGGVVSFFSCLDKVALTIEEKERFMKLEFQEERANLAVEYVIQRGNKINTVIGSLIWHCHQPTPPMNSLTKLQTDQQKMALEYGKTLSQSGWDEISQENTETIIKKESMKCFLNGKFIPISLKNPLEEIRKDLEQSKKELKNRKKYEIPLLLERSSRKV